MLDQFFGAEPILIGKVVLYEEAKAGGKYVYKPSELAQAIEGYKNAGDHAALEQILRELFWICSQGRRPWSLDAEQSFLAMASAGYDLLCHLRAVGKVSYETYAFIDPLRLAFSLECEADRIERRQETENPEADAESRRWRTLAESLGRAFSLGAEVGPEPDAREDKRRWDNTLTVFYRLIRICILIFDCWVSDYPETTTLPATDDMTYLLETGDDSDFQILLTAFAKTEKPQVKQILTDFSNDDEPSVVALAQRLLALYFQHLKDQSHLAQENRKCPLH